EDDVIAAALAMESIDMAATELVRHALEAGGHDNITVVIAEFVTDDDHPTAETQDTGLAGTDENTAQIQDGHDSELACADGKPQIVGAAAMQPRPPTGRAVRPSEHTELDPEEIRYAPRPPRRFRALRWIIGL